MILNAIRLNDPIELENLLIQYEITSPIVMVRIIQYAITLTSNECLSILLKHSLANPNGINSNGHTALDIICGSKDDRTMSLKMLIECGVDLNQGSIYGRPIYLAISTLQLHHLQLLLEYGVNTSRALHHCVYVYSRCAPEHYNPAPVLQLLLNHGADPNELDNKGLTPWMKAVVLRCYRSIDLFISYGIDLNVLDSSGRDIYAIIGTISCDFTRRDFIEKFNNNITYTHKNILK